VKSKDAVGGAVDSSVVYVEMAITPREICNVKELSRGMWSF
jgi:hypothetical protein